MNKMRLCARWLAALLVAAAAGGEAFGCVPGAGVQICSDGNEEAYESISRDPLDLVLLTSVPPSGEAHQGQPVLLQESGGGGCRYLGQLARTGEGAGTHWVIKLSARACRSVSAAVNLEVALPPSWGHEFEPGRHVALR
ncbi:hypothetical protein [Rubrivivax gelatinosus]|uniref:hypothetical protein n=1 Tax=Rubrivivax gelatinosus TaxID=28068 RepID=UPI0012FE1A67|nr:hypothetical protein [Rubrivivax gelatinosus]MBG6083138.1 hypothetical protein [Rubrivivax gelatinosus]